MTERREEDLQGRILVSIDAGRLSEADKLAVLAQVFDYATRHEYTEELQAEPTPMESLPEGLTASLTALETRGAHAHGRLIIKKPQSADIAAAERLALYLMSVNLISNGEVKVSASDACTHVSLVMASLDEWTVMHEHLQGTLESTLTYDVIELE